MKTTLIILSCLLVIIRANIKKKCDNKAEEIALQDCKQQCDVATRGEDCAKCIGNHQDYDGYCKGPASKCKKHEADIARKYCRKQCLIVSDSDFDIVACNTCITNHQDVDMDCKNGQDMLNHCMENIGDDQDLTCLVLAVVFIG